MSVPDEVDPEGWDEQRVTLRAGQPQELLVSVHEPFGVDVEVAFEGPRHAPSCLDLACHHRHHLAMGCGGTVEGSCESIRRELVHSMDEPNQGAQIIREHLVQQSHGERARDRRGERRSCRRGGSAAPLGQRR